MEEAKDALLVSLSAFEKDILFKNNDSPTNRILANYKILGQDGEEKPFMIRYSSLLKQYNRLKKKSENDTSEEEHAEKLNAKQSKIRKLQNSILKIDSKQQNYEEQLGDSTNRKPFENLENTKISEYKTMKSELEKLKWENRRSKKLEESLNSLIVKKNELSFDDQKSRERIAILKEKTSELKKREIEHLDEIERQERVLEAINESLEKDRFFIEGKKISLNESVSAEEAKFNHLIKSFHILRSKIKQLRNEISQAVSRKDHFAVFAEKVETEEKRRKKPEHLGKISQVKHRQFQASEHSKNLLSTVLKIAKFAQAKSDSLKDINSYNAFLKEAKIGRKKYKTQIASAKQDVAVVLAERLRVKAENEKRQSEILSSRNTTNRKIGEAVAELRAKSAEVAKRIYIFEKIATSPAKTLARDCAECGKENVFRIDFEERTTRFLCSNCQTNLAEIEFSENLRFSNKKRKVGKSDRKSKMATNKVKMGKCSVIKNEKLRSAELRYPEFNPEEERTQSLDNDNLVKIEGVEIYSEKYRQKVLKNFEPFPEKEFEELKDRLLAAKNTKIKRITRSGNTYSISKHPEKIITEHKFPRLSEILNEFLDEPDRYRLQILIYLRLFAGWLSNATDDPKPWIKPSPISPLEQFNLAENKKNTKGVDLTNPNFHK